MLFGASITGSFIFSIVIYALLRSDNCVIEEMMMIVAGKL